MRIPNSYPTLKAVKVSLCNVHNKFPIEQINHDYVDITGCVSWLNHVWFSDTRWVISLGGRVDIFITHLIIIIKSTFPSVVIFFRGCVPGVTVLSCVVGFMYIPGKIRYDPMVAFVYLHCTLPHYNHYADLSEGIVILKCLSNTFCRVRV